MIDPVIPAIWDGFKIKRHYRGTTYNIEVFNPEHVSFGVAKVEVDGIEADDNILRPRTEKEVSVKVYLGDVDGSLLDFESNGITGYKF